MPSTGLLGSQECTWYTDRQTCRQNIHTHKIKIFLKDFKSIAQTSAWGRGGETLLSELGLPRLTSKEQKWKGENCPFTAEKTDRIQRVTVSISCDGLVSRDTRKPSCKKLAFASVALRQVQNCALRVGAGEVAALVESLPPMHEVLGLIPGTTYPGHGEHIATIPALAR